MKTAGWITAPSLRYSVKEFPKVLSGTLALRVYDNCFVYF